MSKVQFGKYQLFFISPAYGLRSQLLYISRVLFLAIPSPYSEAPLQESVYLMDNGEKRLSLKKVGMEQIDLAVFLTEEPTK